MKTATICFYARGRVHGGPQAGQDKMTQTGVAFLDDMTTEQLARSLASVQAAALAMGEELAARLAADTTVQEEGPR